MPVDGFFEFTGEHGAKQPRGPKDAPIYQPLLSFTFATTALAARVPLQFPEVF